MTVQEAIESSRARPTPGEATSVDEPDPRWQGIIAVGEFLDKEQQSVWEFIERWGVYPDDDLRIAIATVLLEHLTRDAL
jgi:hypothetical protein